MAFIECWSAVYIDYLNRNRRNRESGLSTTYFKRSQWRTGSSCNAPLWKRTMRSVLPRGTTNQCSEFIVSSNAYPALERLVILWIAVEGMNDCMGPEIWSLHFWLRDLTPASYQEPMPYQFKRNRWQLWLLARVDVGRVAAALKVAQSLQPRFLLALRFKFEACGSIMIFNERDNKWPGPVKAVYSKKWSHTWPIGLLWKPLD